MKKLTLVGLSVFSVFLGACSSQTDTQLNNLKAALSGNYTLTAAFDGSSIGDKFTIETDGNFTLNSIQYQFVDAFSDTQADYKAGSRYFMVTIDGSTLKATEFASSKEEINRFRVTSIATKN